MLPHPLLTDTDYVIDILWLLSVSYFNQNMEFKLKNTVFRKTHIIRLHCDFKVVKRTVYLCFQGNFF